MGCAWRASLGERRGRMGRSVLILLNPEVVTERPGCFAAIAPDGCVSNPGVVPFERSGMRSFQGGRVHPGMAPRENVMTVYCKNGVLALAAVSCWLAGGQRAEAVAFKVHNQTDQEFRMRVHDRGAWR